MIDKLLQEKNDTFDSTRWKRQTFVPWTGGVGTQVQIFGEDKKRDSGFYWDYRKYVGIPEGLRKKVVKSCWDSIGILKKASSDYKGNPKIIYQDSIWITEKITGLHQESRTIFLDSKIDIRDSDSM